MKPKELIESLRLLANQGPCWEPALHLQSAQGSKFHYMTVATKQDVRDLVKYIEELERGAK